MFLLGPSFIVTGVLAFALGLTPLAADKRDVTLRVLPIDTPVRFVPPPAPGGATILVPAISGTW